MDKVLIIAAHPDDDILGCGGSIAKFSKAKQFRVVFLAEGSSCRFDQCDKNHESIIEEIRSRNTYAVEALEMLNVDSYKFYDLCCGRLDAIPIIKINKIVEHEISTFQPRTLLIHSEYDNNNDHRIVFRSVMMAARPSVFRCVEKILSFEVLSSSEWNFENAFHPNYFEKLEKNHVENKWKALSCYKSEIKEYPHPRSNEGMLTQARSRGMQAGVEFAEAYRIVRWVN